MKGKCPICGGPVTVCLFDGNTCEFDWASRPGFWGDTHAWDEESQSWKEKVL